MRMLKLLRLAVFVVCIAAFASGCGGGGGGGAGTDPSTTPGQTDAERIAAARETVAGIVTTANSLAQTANSAAAAVGANEDATAEQIASALAQASAAQAALADVVAASGAASAATTPAAAEMALADAQAALNDLRTAQSAVAGIQSAVNAVAEARRQREEDELALTGGSSLIQHVRDNRKVYDALLPLADTSIPNTNIAEASATNGATFPAYRNAADGSVGTVYPRPQNANQGVLAVTITVGGTAVSSHSKTGRINDPGRLHQGFDLKDDAGRFANAYTDITGSQLVRAISGGALVADEPSTTAVDESRVYQGDTDYLLAGIWLDDSTATPSIQAFAYGSQPITAAAHDFCSAADVTDTTALDKTCTATSGLDTVASVLADNTDKSYTYRGNANGAYMADGKASYFKADVSIEADFQDVGGTGSGSIGGEVTNITAGGERLDGTIELQEQTITGGNLAAAFTSGVAAGVVEGNAYNGAWKGQFFGRRYDRKVVGPVVQGSPNTQAISYTPGLPGSVAGTFYLNKLTGPGGDAAFIGAFGAHR